MDAATFEIVADFLPGLSFILLIIFAAIWFRLRAGTSYGLLNRLYAIVIGGKEFHDSSIAEYWNERKDVERFNALFNTRAKSLKDIQHFRLWIEKHDLDSRTFTSIQRWFDFEKRKVKKLNTWQLALPFIGTFLYVLLSSPLIPLATASSALLKFKDEEQWMWVNETAASSFSYNPFRNKNSDWRISPELCSQSTFDPAEVSKQVKLQPKNVQIICNAFDDPKSTNQINEFIADQRLLWIAVVMSWLFAFNSFKEAIRRADAHRARPYLHNKLVMARLRKEPSIGSSGKASKTKEASPKIAS
ncbi:hypothetical protein ADIMK_3383 [Marinobacterium lacunae]|uniref:Uncharacterized protein n=1 Tax=Marinobacterium lacunae TaxID=1232683 RepID=A0A081FVD7_9GAMM|nr:DUF6216 family protein [Marinobacterium lacunae]KEA62492.1 hypothetical protein ADIMK_3383 [Marinobacterium lacunae]